MAWRNGRRRTPFENDQWLREMYDEGGADFADGASRGYSIRQTFPIIRSAGPGGPTYLQLKWALETIKIWKINSAAGKTVVQYPTEESFTKARGIYRGEHNAKVLPERGGDLGLPAATAREAAPAEPEDGAGGEEVGDLPRVQTAGGDVPEGGDGG